MTKKIMFMVAAALCLTLTGCKESGDTDEPSDGSTSPVALPSSVKDVSLQRCEALDASSGSALNLKVVVKALRLNSNGTYTYGVRYSNGTGCVGSAGTSQGGGQTADGNEDVFRYDQTGTYTASTMASDGSYTVAFTITGNSFTSRTGTMGVPMKDAINTNCTLAMSGGGTTTVPDSTTCLSTVSTYIVPTPPSTTLLFTQRVELTTRGIKMDTPPGLYRLGQSGTSVPSTATYSYMTY
ncbi:MAG: hypothetical protein EOP06_22905 [Proteobacteria bacterium]|nr:MAG: hypothetical protein EOP06_22905 [Pseudomonadota bacterium]